LQTSATLDVESASFRAGSGRLTISGSGIEFVPGFLNFTRRKQWPAESLRSVEVRKGNPSGWWLLVEILLAPFLLAPLITPVLAVLAWPIVALLILLRGAGGTFIVIEDSERRSVYHVQRLKPAKVRAIVREAGFERKG
jgi:hypothetical protein